MAKKLDTTPFYRRILTDAVHIAWAHKQLWIFGFFATLIGFGAVSEVFFTAAERTATTLPSAASGGGYAALVPGLTVVRTIIAYSSFPAAARAFFLILFALLVVVFAWMTMVSVGALISDSRKISRGGEPTFDEGVKSGSKSFWKLLGVHLLSKAVIFVALLVVCTNLFASLRDGSLTSGFFYVGSFMVLIAISFVASLAAVYASMEVVVRDAEVVPAVESALHLVRKHWLVSLEMALLLMLLSLVIGAGAALVVLVLSVPLIFLIAVASALGAASAVYGIVTITAALLMISIVCVGSFLTAMQATAWTLLWNELADRHVGALIHRVAHYFQTRFLFPRKR